MDERNVIAFPEGGKTMNKKPIPVIKFGNVIKKRRKAKKMTQADLAETMGVIRNTVVNWEADKAKPDFETIPLLCSVLDISLEELFSFRGNNDFSDDERKLLKNYRDLSTIGKLMALKAVAGMLTAECEAEGQRTCRSFGILEKVKGSFAAGNDEPFTDETSEAVFIRNTSISTQADFIAHVKGRSMEPAYRDGDFVYCKKASAALPGQDVVCITNEGRLIKRIAEDGMLFSVNPDPIYKVRKMYDDDDLQIKGIVIGVVQPSDYPSKRELITLNDLRWNDMKAFIEEHEIDDEW